MSIPQYAMNHKTVIHFILMVVIFGGIWAFPKLGKKEDAPFVIKTVVLTTVYAGASQYEVEQLVSDVIEKEVQNSRGVDYVRSESTPGVSVIKVDFYQHFTNEDMPQLFDELRRKVKTAQDKLPDEASEININDDFGDVYGFYYAISADEGFTYSELKDYTDFLKKQLVTISGVGKVTLFGEQKDVINIEFKKEEIVNAGITPQQIVHRLQTQNQLIQQGRRETGETYTRIDAEGAFASVDDISNMLLEGTSDYQFALKDLAKVSKGYYDPPVNKFRHNGRISIALGISTALGGNAIEVGEAVDNKIAELEAQIPIGITITPLYREDLVAIDANKDFMINLAISVSIVVVIIMMAMGVRPGILIGSSLLFTIAGTLILMLLTEIDLHRTSLSAIIIAMGMLVDNAIVVSDNAIINMKKGQSKVNALINGAVSPQWGLLGATFIAIVSFLPLYLAPANASEIAKPLFNVLALSLFLSWIFALIQTTVYGDLVLKAPEDDDKDPFDTPFYRTVRSIVATCIRRRWLTLTIVASAFIASVFLFGYVRQSFFPPLVKPYFKIDYFRPDGTTMYKLEDEMKELEAFLLKKEEIKNVSITFGQSPLRYYLASTNYGPKSNFANILVELHNSDSTKEMMLETDQYIRSNFPDAIGVSSLFKLSPAPDASIEATFMGPNLDTLRALSERTKNIMREYPSLVEHIRDDWGNKTVKGVPRYSQTKGQRAGISKQDMALSFKMLTDGIPTSTYREGDRLMPILLKDIDRDTYDNGNLASLPVFGEKGQNVQLGDIVEGGKLEWENFTIRRRNRQRAIAASCEPVFGIENVEAEQVLVPLIEAIELPIGYSLFWNGIKYNQDVTQQAIAGQLPLAIIIMISILVILFNSLKKMVAIFMMIPLILIGVVAGFIMTGTIFNFFATLGLLGLIGMVIKNAIVLVEQIEIEREESPDISHYEAVVRSSISRSLPVIMAAGTTILGMAPLAPDAMFGGMAITIMGGLFGATLLTLIVLPVIYCVIFGLKKDLPKNDAETN